MNGEAEIFAWLEQVQLFLEEQGIRTQVDVLTPPYESGYNFIDLGVKKRLSARDGHRRRAALIRCPEALLRGQILLQDVGRVLDLPASGAGQIATEERLQHQDQGITASAG
jgi:hypothetical protein